MRRIRPEYLDADRSDRSIAADVLVREEPDEDDDDEEGDGEEKEGEEEDDEGYSEGNHHQLTRAAGFPQSSTTKAVCALHLSRD